MQALRMTPPFHWARPRWMEEVERLCDRVLLLKDGRAMRKAQGRTLGQMALAANTPMMLKAGLVDGDPTAGVLASGQVVGVIDDLPSCEELVDRVVTGAAVGGYAAATLRRGRRLSQQLPPEERRWM